MLRLILELIGMTALGRLIGSLLATFCLLAIWVLWMGWSEESARAARLLPATGQITALDADCRMRSAASPGLRSLDLRGPCDSVDEHQSRYPDRVFRIDRTEMVAVEYLTKRGVETRARVARGQLALSPVAAIGDRVNFKYDPAAASTYVIAQASSTISRWLAYALAGIVVLAAGLLATALGGFRELDRRRALAR